MAKKTTSTKDKTSDCPKRPLSAYNMFFQLARQRVVGNDLDDDDGDKKPSARGQEGKKETQQAPVFTRAEIFATDFDQNNVKDSRQQRPHRRVHGRISFIELAKTISAQWNALPAPQRRLFEERADQEKSKYAIQLEEWLVKQTPTPQIKKRLGALRRGSLGKFIKAHHQEKEQQQRQEKRQLKHPPLHSRPHTATRTTSPSASMIMSPYANHSRPPVANPIHLAPRRVSNDQGSTPWSSSFYHDHDQREIHKQRVSNLERLYQMQIQLYNEQVQLHEEYTSALPPMQDSTTMAPAGSHQHPHERHFHQPSPSTTKTPSSSLSHHVSPPDSPYENHPHYISAYPQDESYLVPSAERWYPYSSCPSDLSPYHLPIPRSRESQEDASPRSRRRSSTEDEKDNCGTNHGPYPPNKFRKYSHHDHVHSPHDNSHDDVLSIMSHQDVANEKDGLELLDDPMLSNTLLTSEDEPFLFPPLPPFLPDAGLDPQVATNYSGLAVPVDAFAED